MNKQIFDEILELWKNRKPNETLWTQELAATYGYNSAEGLRSAFRRFKKNMAHTTEKAEKIYKKIDESGKSDYQQSIEFNSDQSITSERIIAIEAEDLKNPKILLELHGFDVELWDLIYAKNNYWTMQSKDSPDGRITLYQSKITAKAKTRPEWSKRFVDEIFAKLQIKDLNQYSFKYNPKAFEENGKFLVIPIADLHLGLLATDNITGNEYNMEIAEDYFRFVILDTIRRVADQKFEKIILVVGNDFMNSDNLIGSTTAGTPQDNVTFWFNLFDKAIELILWATLELSKISEVEVINIVSNHDQQSMYGVMKAIDFYFKDDGCVTVDTSQLPRKYLQLGKTLLALSHDISIKEALSIVTMEAKHMWSECNRYYLMLGHLHRQMIYDRQGDLEVYRLPTVSGWSRWSANKGYIHKDKRSQTFIIDSEYGIDTIFNIVI